MIKGLDLSAGTAITKESRNQTIDFGLGLYCLVASFLLLHVICASVPTEGTKCLGFFD